jgi:hypothetical protein
MQSYDDQPATGPEGIDVSRTKSDDEWSAIRSLTIQEIAEKLGISTRAARALVEASQRGARARDTHEHRGDERG